MIENMSDLLVPLDEIAARVTDDGYTSSWRQGHGSRYLVLLPLLEHEFSNVVQDFPAALAGQDGGAEVLDWFTVDELILYALSWRTHWGAKAVAWLQQGAELNEDIVTSIDRAVAEKRWTQKDRHIAFRLARRWEQEHK